MNCVIKTENLTKDFLNYLNKWFNPRVDATWRKRSCLKTSNTMQCWKFSQLSTYYVGLFSSPSLLLFIEGLNNVDFLYTSCCIVV